VGWGLSQAEDVATSARRWLGRASERALSLGSPELALTSLNDLKLVNDPTGKLDFARFSHTTNSDEVRLGGSDYKIYVEPLELSTGEQSSHWIICGLVESGHFRHQTWAVSYTVLIVLAFLTSLIPLSWPFLKILFIGPKDRLRRADVYFVTFSLVIGVAVITLFSLWVYTYIRKQKELDGQLAALSRSIAKKYDVELRQSLLQIDRLNARKVAEDANAEKEKSGQSSAPAPEPESGDKTATRSIDDGKVVKADSSHWCRVRRHGCRPTCGGPDSVHRGPGRCFVRSGQPGRCLLPRAIATSNILICRRACALVVEPSLQLVWPSLIACGRMMCRGRRAA